MRLVVVVVVAVIMQVVCDLIVIGDKQPCRKFERQQGVMAYLNLVLRNLPESD
jgi:hypothetical protein